MFSNSPAPDYEGPSCRNTLDCVLWKSDYCSFDPFVPGRGPLPLVAPFLFPLGIPLSLPLLPQAAPASRIFPPTHRMCFWDQCHTD
eukprot:scaffold71503_cov21-Tisochrysis_lutea.AAC.1